MQTARPLKITLELAAAALLKDYHYVDAENEDWEPPDDVFDTPCSDFLPYLDQIKREARAAEEEAIRLVEANIPIRVKVRVDFGPRVKPSVNEG